MESIHITKSMTDGMIYQLFHQYENIKETSYICDPDVYDRFSDLFNVWREHKEDWNSEYKKATAELFLNSLKDENLTRSNRKSIINKALQFILKNAQWNGLPDER